MTIHFLLGKSAKLCILFGSKFQKLGLFTNISENKFIFRVILCSEMLIGIDGCQ